ncbi:MAG: phosphatidate cytidylyltransferase [Candidatus Limnocylindria bacterium]
MTARGRRALTGLGYGAVVLAAAFAPSPALALLVGLLALVAYAELARLFARSAAGPARWGIVLVAGLQLPRLAPGREAWVDAAIIVAGLVAAAIGWASAGHGPGPDRGGAGVRRRRGAGRDPLGGDGAVARPGRGSHHPAAGGPMTPGARGVEPRGRIGALAFTVAGAVYVGWLLGYLVDLGAAGPAHTARPVAAPLWLLLALVPTWAADVVAYAAGTAFGRRKLAPRISPGKTWEGTIAGFTAAAAAALGVAFAGGLPVLPATVAAFAIGPIALAGDLFESYLKRRAGAKDSGGILPGHGGVLDRVDSLIAVAPVVAAALALAGRVG